MPNSYTDLIDRECIFQDFMIAQCQAIEASGLEPEQWIAQNSEQFRQQWEESHHE